MRIESIHISGFGKWSDVTFDFNDQWQVVFGPNEAGKTTVKAFILGVLFGFPKGRKAGNQLYVPRSGAQYGGSLVLSTKKGRYRVERLGRTKSTLTVTALDTGLEMPNPEKWLADLIAPLEESDFRQVYSFDESELGAVAELTADDFDQVLLSYTRPQAQRFLKWAGDREEEGQALFAQGKNGKRPLNLANREYQKLLAERPAEQEKYSRYQELLANQEALDEELNRSRTKEQSLLKKLSDQESLTKAWPLFEQAVKLKADAGSKKVNQQVQLETVQEVQRLEQTGNWLFEQQQANQKEIDKLRALLAQPQEKDQGQVMVNDSLNQLLNIQIKKQGLVQQLTNFAAQFDHGLPKALSKREQSELASSSVMTTTLGGIALVLAIVIVAVVSAPLGLGIGIVAAILLAKAYRDFQARQLIAERYQPFNMAEAIEKQEAVALAWQQQAQLQSLDQEAELAKKQLADNLVHYQIVDGEKLATWSTEQLVDWTRKWLQSQESTDTESTSRRLNELLTTGQTLAKKIDDQKQALSQILSEYGVRELKDFYQLVNEEKADEATREKGQLIHEQLGQERYEQLLSLFQEHGAESFARLEDELKRLRQDLQAIREDERGQQQQLANQQSEMKQLTADGGLAQLEQKLANQESDLKADYTRYLAKVLAKSVVNQAFLGQEDSLSKKVLEQASAYMAQLTKGRYQELELEKGRLFSTEDSNESDSKRTFQTAELSSGTRDLLFLSLRLALASTLHAEEPLPILIDDALVHLDEERREATLALLQEVALDQQILFWTFDEKLNTGQAINLLEY
ncbi:ATP-binding protein [Fructobacillus durionis]|uniref:AAA domain-containing protein n=1 Tax=Fructobacillus durionis TaxID=283737 RepID=A0A1I1EER9_9LACO|nr:AAA family ATPase [Fructobacillus durionis]SFB83423.1 AAA domain-containing protein [Fructobacillus durionis]